MKPIKPGTHRVPLARSGRGVITDPNDVLVHRPHVGTSVYLDVQSPFIRLAITPEVARVLIHQLDNVLNTGGSPA